LEKKAVEVGDHVLVKERIAAFDAMVAHNSVGNVVMF
jgi:hypothetical protein